MQKCWRPFRKSQTLSVIMDTRNLRIGVEENIADQDRPELCVIGQLSVITNIPHWSPKYQNFSSTLLMMGIIGSTKHDSLLLAKPICSRRSNNRQVKGERRRCVNCPHELYYGAYYNEDASLMLAVRWKPHW